MAGRTLFSFLRTSCIIKRYKSDVGIKYQGFTYYPRFPDQVDPPYEPTKLFMVQRVKPVKGNPYWDKKLLRHFCLDGKQNDIAIVKNIPEVNAMLWKIKHLVKITPITCANGLPEEGDFEGTRLTHTGEFKVSPLLKVESKQIAATKEYKEDKIKFDGKTLQKYLTLKWLNGW